MTAINRKKIREKRRFRIRKKVTGTTERPRLVIYRSLEHVEGQLVDDLTGKTIVGLSSKSKDIDVSSLEKKTKTSVSRLVGKTLAEKAIEKGIKSCVFDRGGYIYHGRVKAFAEGARKGGLEF